MEETYEEKKARLLAKAKGLEAEAKAGRPGGRELDLAERIAGSTPYRALQGFVDLPLGAAQFMANKYGVGDETMNNFMNRREALMRTGRGDEGDDFDFARLGGNVAFGMPFGSLGTGGGLLMKTGKGALLGGAFAGTSPVTGDPDNYWDTKASQMGVGTALGALFPGGVAAGKAVARPIMNIAQDFGEKLAPVFSGAQDNAKRFFKQLIPDDADRLGAAGLLRAADDPVTPGTASELVTPMNLPPMSQLQRYIDDLDPTTKVRRNASKRQVRQDLLDEFAGTDDQIEAAIADRAARTSALREQVLGREARGVKGSPDYVPPMEGSIAANTRAALRADEVIAKNQPGPGTRNAVGVFEEVFAPDGTRIVANTTRRIDPRPNAGSGLPISTAGRPVQRNPPPQMPPGNRVSSAASATQQRAALESQKQYADEMAKHYTTVWGARPGRVANPMTERSGEIAPFIDDARMIESAKKFALEQAQSVRNALQAHGIEPLTTGNVVARLISVANEPGTASAAKTLIRKVSKMIKEESVDGMIDPIRLDRMRRIDLDQFAERMFSKEGSMQSQGAVAAQAKKVLDDAIEAAGGGGWKRYLKTFSEMSRDIDRMVEGKVLRQSLYPGGKSISDAAERSSVFSKALAKLKETDKGRGRGNALFDDEAFRKLNALEADLTRSADDKALSIGNLPGEAFPAAPQGPPLLDRTAMIVNSALRGAFGIGQKRNLEYVSNLLTRDPQKGYSALADLLEETATPGAMKKVLEAFPGVADELVKRGLLPQMPASGAGLGGTLGATTGLTREMQAPSDRVLKQALGQ